jgi:hypothetical protein
VLIIPEKVLCLIVSNCVAIITFAFSTLFEVDKTARPLRFSAKQTHFLEEFRRVIDDS